MASFTPNMVIFAYFGSLWLRKFCLAFYGVFLARQRQANGTLHLYVEIPRGNVSWLHSVGCVSVTCTCYKVVINEWKYLFTIWPLIDFCVKIFDLNIVINIQWQLFGKLSSYRFQRLPMNRKRFLLTLSIYNTTKIIKLIETWKKWETKLAWKWRTLRYEFEQSWILMGNTANILMRMHEIFNAEDMHFIKCKYYNRKT